jgi:hypothetical protein
MTATTTMPDPQVLTPDIVGAARIRAHTYESFGRAIVAEALRRAEIAETLDGDGVTLSTEFTVRPGSTAGRDPAVRSFCLDVDIFGASIHIYVE